MKKARYISLEGTEGLGKTTQAGILVEYLTECGYKVLHTKEPGTPLSPMTMELRNLMLNAEYTDQITPLARVFISQAIRSIHLERVIEPALYTHDFIIQDRGMLSGLAYGIACGHDFGTLSQLMNLHEKHVITRRTVYKMYDDVILLHGDVAQGLSTARAAKQEFIAGDAIEAKGYGFMKKVAANFYTCSKVFNCRNVDVRGKNIAEVHAEIRNILKL